MDINSTIARRLKTSPRGRRAGIALYRGWVRVAPTDRGPRVLVNSLPKAGTHLVMSLLDAVPGLLFAGRHATVSETLLDEKVRVDAVRSARAELARCAAGHYVTGHLAFDEGLAAFLDDRAFKVVHVVRDPRALIASTAPFIFRNPRHPLHALARERFPDESALIRGLVDGFSSDDGRLRYVGVGERWARFAPWLGRDTSMVVRFEDLVGSRGGGNDETQAEVVRSLLTHIGRPASAAPGAAQAAFDSRAATFRAPAVEGWREAMDSETSERILDRGGDVVRALGYS